MNSAIVIDASITMAWCFADEGTPATEDVQDRLASSAGLVPGHWFLEVANSLAMAERSNRTTAAKSEEFIRLLTTFKLEVDDAARERVFTHVLPLARAHRLTSYDAGYLDLAVRRSAPIASLDLDLRRAAQSLGVIVLGM